VLTTHAFALRVSSTKAFDTEVTEDTEGAEAITLSIGKPPRSARQLIFL
jgi:hypothetical protein